MLKGHQKKILSPGTNQKLHIFGALNFISNGVTYEIFDHKTQWQMETFLLKLFSDIYQEDYLIIALDNVNYHKTPLIEQILYDYSDRVFVLWLPKYYPELNLIERFWEHLKQIVFDSYYWGCKVSLEQAAHEFFEEHNNNPTSEISISFRKSRNLSGPCKKP